MQINLSDIHIPFQDNVAWDLTLEIVRVVRPSYINLLGDMLDFYRVSSFDKDPARFEEGGLQNELDVWYRMAGDLIAVAGSRCKFRYIPGNHEDRLRRHLWRNPELHGLRALELPSLMRLDELGIEYSGDEIEIVPGKLLGKHGEIVRRDSAYSAKAEIEKERFAVSTVTGHTHRLGVYYVSTRFGMFRAIENGCLCNCEPEYVKRPNWQLGCSLVSEWDDVFHVDSIPYLADNGTLSALVLGNVVTV